MRFLLRITIVRMVLLFGLIVFFVCSPYDFNKMARRNREAHTQRALAPMEIALVWPHNNANFFIEGAELAIREINTRGGVIIADEKGNPVPARLVAREYNEFEYSTVEALAAHIAKNPNLSAVIGHSMPDSAIRASVAYQDNGLLYISPSVSDSRLTQHGFWTTVRTAPADADISRAMIEFALKNGWQKAAILYVRNTYGSTFNNLLRADMGEMYARGIRDTNQVLNLELTFQGYYGEDETSFYPLISALLKQKFDVVFLADSLIGRSMPRTLALISQLREMGVKGPLMGTDELHSGNLWPALGERSDDIFAVNAFDPQAGKTNQIANQFRVAFRKAYTNQPTMQGSKAYEAVLLVAQAAERAQSKMPLKMATMFRSTAHWNGLQGEGAYDFSLDGGIQKKKVIIEQMKDGLFKPPVIPELFNVCTNEIEPPLKYRRK